MGHTLHELSPCALAMLQVYRADFADHAQEFASAAEAHLAFAPPGPPALGNMLHHDEAIAGSHIYNAMLDAEHARGADIFTGAHTGGAAGAAAPGGGEQEGEGEGEGEGPQGDETTPRSKGLSLVVVIIPAAFVLSDRYHGCERFQV
jgi:hypothetical protein